MLDVTLPIAFVFGLISFLSPCVLPLVPAYISYLGGRMLHTADAATGPAVMVGANGQAAVARGFSARFGLLMHGLAFVSGFTLVFVLLGIVTTALIQQVGGANISNVIGMISRLGGMLIIFFGLHFGGFLPDVFARIRAVESGRIHALFTAALAVIGSLLLVWGFAGRLDIWVPANAAFPALPPAPIWPDLLAVAAVCVFVLLLVLGGAFQSPKLFNTRLTNTVEFALYADTRRQMQQDTGSGLLGSLLMGIVFSAGWSPCIGTVYGSILTMSAMTGDVAQASLQLAAYSFGLGVPFLLAAVALDSVQGIFRRINRRMRLIKRVSGVLLVLVGILVLTGQLQRLTAELATGEFANFSLQLEEQALDVLVGGE